MLQEALCVHRRRLDHVQNNEGDKSHNFLASLALGAHLPLRRSMGMDCSRKTLSRRRDKFATRSTWVAQSGVFLRHKHGAALFALGKLDFSSCLMYRPVSCSLSSCRLRCTRKLDCFPWLDSAFVRQFPETLGTLKLHQTLPLHRTVVSSQCFSQRPTLLSITNRSYGPQLNFVHAMLMAPRTPFLSSVVPACMGNPLWLGNTGNTSWFFWLRNMVLILRSTGPYSFMAKIALS